MKKLCKYSAAVWLAASVIFTCHATVLSPNPSPNNYNEIKRLLDRCANEIDYSSSDADAARSALWLRADEAVPALMILFEENKNQQYRTAVISVFFRATKSRGLIAPFLCRQFNAAPDQWKGKIWIKAAFTLLSDLDPNNTRLIARKALLSPDLDIQLVAIEALGKVGVAEDIQTLKLHAERRVSTNPKHVDDELSLKAKLAADQVNERS